MAVLFSTPRKTMSRAAFSAKVFSVYLFIVSTVVVIAPNLLLSLFGLPPTSEVWIRIVGVLAFNIGIYAWSAAAHEDRNFLVASVVTRVVFFAAVTAFAVLGLASPILVLFGVTDLLGGIWTHCALKADTRAAQLCQTAQERPLQQA